MGLQVCLPQWCIASLTLTFPPRLPALSTFPPACRAMGGTVLFQDALKARLGVMNPSAADLQRFLAQHPPSLSPGIPELVAALRGQGKLVFLVSGGFRVVIHPIAEVGTCSDGCPAGPAAVCECTCCVVVL